MTKEDKQIIKRAIKENWRIGDRTRLKRLLEKNLKLYRENIGLKERLELLNLNANIAVRDLNDLLTKATEIIKSLIALHYNPVVTKDDLKKQDKILEHAEQFLKEIEK